MDTVTFINLLEFILGLVVLIVIHEFGHFIAARLLNIEVEEFGIGFPPRIARLFRLWGTDFTLNAIPLGGFVRPKGENDPEVPGGLAAANPWKRIIVLASGPAMNLLAAVLLGAILFFRLGEPISNQVKIDYVAPSSPAEAAGLQKGDIFISVNGETIDGFEALKRMVDANLDKMVTIVYLREGQTLTATLTPRKDPPKNQGAMGIVMGNPTRPVGLGVALVRGAQAVYENIHGIVTMPIRLAQGTASPQEGRLVGYYGMFEIYQQINALAFFMVISVSLGLLNLMPIPALDGGRILLTLPEILIRKRIPPRYENMIHLVGFALLLLLIIYINVQDIINPLALP